MATYDTAEIRRAANSVRSSREHLSSTVLGGLRQVEAEVEENFQGRAADALADRLTQMDADVRQIDEKLDILYRTLMKFAQDMDEADQALAAKL